MGYPTGVKGYKLLDIESNSIFISRHVVFHEELFPFAKQDLSSSETAFFKDPVKPPPMQTSPLDESNSVEPSSVEIVPSANSTNVPESFIQTSHRRVKKLAYLQDYYCHSVTSSTIHQISEFLSYDKLSPSYLAFLVSIDKELEPTTYTEAHKHWVWREAAATEIDALEGTRTWVVYSLPPNKKAIGCKWVFKIKYNADGTVERYKARLVAKGYTQQEGIDYTETFSPVAKLNSVKLLLSLAAILGWSLTQLDISNEFLNGDLDEEIYMKLPPGYSSKKGDLHTVCKLEKSIYGLKQASRQWFLKFQSTLLGLGFNHLHSDHTCFLKHTDGAFLCVLVYVDDIIIPSNNDSVVTALKLQLHSHFKLCDLGALKYFLGLEIARSSERYICFTKKICS